MKVLQVIGILDRGGAETLLMNIYENIDRDRYQFDFLVFEDKEFDYSDKVKDFGGNIIFLESPQKIGMFSFIKRLKKLIKDNKYDIVHAHTLFNCGPVVFAAFLAGVKKRISHSHNTKILDEKKSLKKTVYFFLSKILINTFSSDCLACGEEAGKFLYYWYRKFTVIKNGIDVERYDYCESIRTELKIKNKIDDDSLVIGNIGRLNFQKNQTFLLDIFSRIIKKQENVYLFILGDGELKEELMEKARELQIDENVKFLGNIPNANQYYSVFDLFLFPSLFEGLPYTLIEAQDNGLPILASDTISDECNISNTINFMSLEAPIDDWCDKSLDLMKQKERYNNKKYIEEHGYSIKNTTKLIEKIYGGYNEKNSNV